MKFKILLTLLSKRFWKRKRYNFGFDGMAFLEQKNKLSYSEISFIIKFFVEERKGYRYTDICMLKRICDNVY